MTNPNTLIHEEEEEIIGVVSSPIEDEWVNIHGDMVFF
jgi:hypothetical protein